MCFARKPSTFSYQATILRGFMIQWFSGEDQQFAGDAVVLQGFEQIQAFADRAAVVVA